MPQRLDLGRALVVLGALLLLVSLFLDWYDAGGTAWEAFELVDMLLAALAGAAVWAAVRGGERAAPVLRAAPFVALAVVIVQLLNAPPVLQLAEDALRVEGAGDPDTGAWLALSGAALMAAGAVLAVARISVHIDLSDRDPGAPGVSFSHDDDDAPAPAPASDRAEAPTTVAPATAPTTAQPATRRPTSLLGGDRPEPEPPIKGGPPPDPGVHQAPPLKPGPDRDPAP